MTEGVSLWDQFAALLASPMTQRSLLAALIVGVAAPVIGTYLVQRRLSLLGDGIGHVALTGVALGWLVGAATGATDLEAYAVPGAMIAAVAGAIMIEVVRGRGQTSGDVALALLFYGGSAGGVGAGGLAGGAYAAPGAMAAAVAGAILIEVVRGRGQTSGDVALALLFYGGIAGGVVIIGIAGGTNANLMAYLFGSLATVSSGDLVVTLIMSAGILAVGLGLRTALFAVCQDEEFARSTGLPVRAMTILIAVVAALTVTVAMRVVGLLLVSALMIVPVAVAQLITSSFHRTMVLAMGIGAVVCVTGLTITFFHRLAPGAMIVVVAVCLYAVVATVRPLLLARRPARRQVHPQIHDDVPLAHGQAGAPEWNAAPDPPAGIAPCRSATALRHAHL